MKKFFSLVLALTILTSLAGCSGNATATTAAATTKAETAASVDATEAETTTADTTAAAEDYTIGWSVYNAAYEFFISMESGVVDRAAELGITVITHDEKEDEAEMVTGCTNLIAQGIDALVISPCKPEAMNTIVELAHEAGIPVIIVDIGTGDSDYDAFIISDVFGGGQMAADYALELIAEKSITSKNAAIIKCEESAIYARQRGEGFKANIVAAGYTITDELTGNSSQDEGYNVMQDILAKSTDLAVVFCENDNMALGAAAAIDEAGLTGKIMVIGFNADAAAIEAIKDGTMQGTIAQQPYEMGALGVDLAYTLIKGEKITYDEPDTKMCYAAVYLVDQTGEKAS